MVDIKKVFVKTYGCQMNVYDSERMIESFQGKGYTQTDNINQADMILLNTCHIREKAAEKVYSELGRLKTLKAENPNLKIGVAGCVAQAEGQEIINRQPIVDLVVGPQAYHRLPSLIDKVHENKKALDTDFPVEDKFLHLPKRPLSKRGPSAFLTVQEGCDKFCSFCVVPYTRGVEVSRDPTRVVKEAKELVSRGVREVTLLGQNVNAYHGEFEGHSWSLTRLIEELSTIQDLLRIRFTTSHPNDMDEELISAFGTHEKLMPYLHLPVQSGSDRILKAMNRKHTSKSYKQIIKSLRSIRPDLLLSGDFIVGFPGETDLDFQETLDLVREVKFGQAYSFRYSARPGTPAAEKDAVPKEIAVERLHKLQALLTIQQKEVQSNMVGKTLSVLFEKPGRKVGQLIGKSEYLHAVHVVAPTEFIGTVKSVKVVESLTNSLSGELLI
ncbi:MAG: tRNA (N6-isopentenyl adenosine(37)-C2)-methylthiotransferase MiaB [Paracoccaceae bacterium]|jgi:tRNA-2-methylthio-N6-dimethylallyladenosine synthase|nr:tRNA (N6-isopentenyl adenosine(37)-C2)-methylthiotransferase MiaB [Paracoccaceae bacterium]MDG1299907.1 tRNA (N6-isopentenyl adenosine(37)-C2)-methylthiotransferase MiaB [Paracoccaceae bacterium]MDG2374342.1 tRNA (N6-isopentenyl adenosine(37)-C2)-methylthiotransferase MiaB [Paracoccaceae bacterium]|tara:strand:- start:14992 stop:16314 length:1323 start_codon:yes stop_codon:yes gene_type:complete